MGLYEHAQEFFGKPVIEWRPGVPLNDPSGATYRIGFEYDETEAGMTWENVFNQFLSTPGSGSVSSFVVGVWGPPDPLTDSTTVVKTLSEASGKLTALRDLFIGDIVSEEFEISWIEQSDMAPIFAAYPELEHFGVRGGMNLRFGPLNHNRLRSLVVESGGLDVSVVRDITSSSLPELEHLELWLGTEEYGGNSEIVDLAPILSGKLFPKLHHLGLRDSELTDAIAASVTHSPLLERLRVLDLSLGTLSDDGAAALLAGPGIKNLEFLDLHHHYCSDEMVSRLEALGIEVDMSDKQEPDVYEGEATRYVAVGE
ncbi:MAG TPA: STM4015 family protein [Pyrinomonadaceae bacterium]|nr:STM4015 family protein [Pyrinomonadaceae bacterium]